MNYLSPDTANLLCNVNGKGILQATTSNWFWKWTQFFVRNLGILRRSCPLELLVFLNQMQHNTVLHFDKKSQSESMFHASHLPSHRASRRPLPACWSSQSFCDGWHILQELIAFEFGIQEVEEEEEEDEANLPDCTLNGPVRALVEMICRYVCVCVSTENITVVNVITENKAYGLVEMNAVSRSDD